MKIDKPGKALPVGSAGEPRGRVPTKGPSTPSASAQPASSTSVSLGSTAAQLSGLESSMTNTTIVDAGKVAEIKQAISDGHFKVNSGVVADQLIKTVRDLIARGN